MAKTDQDVNTESFSALLRCSVSSAAGVEQVAEHK